MAHILFIAIPKTGSSSVRSYLTKVNEATSNINYDCPGHKCKSKFRDDKYTKVCIIRDPIKRYISTVNYTIGAKHERERLFIKNNPGFGINFILHDNFTAIIHNMVSFSKQCKYIEYYKPQHIFIYENDLEVIKEFIEDLAGEKFNIPMPNKNVSKAIYTVDNITDDIRSGIHKHYIDDIILYETFRSKAGVN